MGYTTNFDGEFTLDRPLAPEHAAYLRQFAEVRHMKRDPKKMVKLPDPLREAVGLPLGHEGAYYVGTDRYGEGLDDRSVIDHNRPPGQPTFAQFSGPNHSMDWTGYYEEVARSITEDGAQPGLWCQWVPTPNNDAIEWDGGEKFYEYVEWLEYLIAHFLKPWGYILNGRVDWEGEDSSDRGAIFVRDNVVKAVEARIEIKDPFAELDQE